MSKRPQRTALIATCIKTGKETLYPSIRECADQGHFSYQYVQQCLRGLIPRHGGHTFRPVSGVRPVEKVRPRVHEIAQLRNSGHTTAEISAITGLKPDTVQKYQKQAARLGITTHIMPER